MVSCRHMCKNGAKFAQSSKLPLSTLASCLLRFLSSEVPWIPDGGDRCGSVDQHGQLHPKPQAWGCACLLPDPKVEQGNNSTLVHLLRQVQRSSVRTVPVLGACGSHTNPRTPARFLSHWKSSFDSILLIPAFRFVPSVGGDQGGYPLLEQTGTQQFPKQKLAASLCKTWRGGRLALVLSVW